ncbi:DNA repair protein RecO [Cyanobium sp. ATX 6A2]|uniref:DNA repair protein RecO n=1 Tax=Cyanobium sp. ATX 6A2 TaxID=2823700 RepID=UPI0020CCAE56|nr:DNA repair protein RecO [Cyanobium sp. ATX 6A2]MCP9888841.1 DNA repair protein RecO [Cyanobium sp. ATX 6A2]
MAEFPVEGLALSCRPLGENDRLLTLLSDSHGLIRLAVPGARRPKSSLAAAVPLAHLRLQVGGNRGLRRVRQLRLLRSYGGLGQQLETLAAAQALAELCLALVPDEVPAPGMLADLLLQLGRLEAFVREPQAGVEALAVAVQGSVHLLALGGYALPLGRCARSGEPLQPPIGDRNWRSSFVPADGLMIGSHSQARLVLNASELALLQRLVRPAPPRRRDGVLMGPPVVWLRLLELVACWCDEHLGRRPRAFRLLANSLNGLLESGAMDGDAPP